MYRNDYAAEYPIAVEPFYAQSRRISPFFAIICALPGDGLPKLWRSMRDGGRNQPSAALATFNKTTFGNLSSVRA